MIRSLVRILKRAMPARGYTQDEKGTIRRIHPKVRGKAVVKQAKRDRQRVAKNRKRCHV